MNNRIVFIGERIDEDSTAIIVAQMLALESEAPNEPITLYINATGGDAILRCRDRRRHGDDHVSGENGGDGMRGRAALNDFSRRDER